MAELTGKVALITGGHSGIGVHSRNWLPVHTPAHDERQAGNAGPVGAYDEAGPVGGLPPGPVSSVSACPVRVG
jgi:hypothetical protein